MTRLAWFCIPLVLGCASTLSAATEVSSPQPSAALTAADFWPASQPSAQPAPHTIAPLRAQRRPTSETASNAALTERITYISVVQGQRRVVYSRRYRVVPNAVSGAAPVYEYYESDKRALSVLTSEGLCQTTEGRSFRVTLHCGRRSGAWTGFELEGCAFPEAGPLVVFQGHEPLRVQSLVELPAATGPEARAFEGRVRGQSFEGPQGPWAEAQREMERMQTAAAGEPPPPPTPAAQLGIVRTAFGVWMVDALTDRGFPLMVTTSSLRSDFRRHHGTRWHTLVAGPRDTDYAYLIGTRSYSWPVVVPARGGAWPTPRYVEVPPFGWIGPAMCADP
ncbi:MAG: hypothetical protein AB8H86_10675 [Polyangiales bacterium]